MHKRLVLLLLLHITVANASSPGGTIAAGTPAATPWFISDGGTKGPTVMIVGGVHGDEPAGAAAAEQVCHWPIVRGKLIVLPRANVLALNARKRLIPNLESALSNLNRNFSKAREGGPPRGDLATALWNFAKQQKPDWVVDLHEGSDFNELNRKSVGSSIIAFPSENGKAAAAVMLAAVNASITNSAHQFKRLGPPVDGSLARAAGVHLGAQAMIIETTMKSQPLSRRVRQHRVMVHALLRHLGMLNENVTPEWMTSRGLVAQPASRRDGARLVALYDAEGTGGTGVPRIKELLSKETNTMVTCMGPEDIRGGALSQFDVVIFPGGSGSGEARPLGEEGRARVKRFVEDGGGYVGICAGAYLATSGYSWGLKILNAKTVSPKWRRGQGMVKLELEEKGRELFGDIKGTFECKYANGPILCPAEMESPSRYETLALFRTEVAEHDAPKGVMINSPAIVSGRCGKGRVICFSPHPEQTKGLEAFVSKAAAWVSGCDPWSAARGGQ